MSSRVITPQPRNATRERIIANLKIKKGAARGEKIATILPKFIERKGKKQRKTPTTKFIATKFMATEFITRATKLSCKFLPAAKGTATPSVIAKSSVATTIATYLKSCYEKGDNNGTALPILIDAEQRKTLTELDILKKIEPYCKLNEAQKITDFAATPFPPFSIQHANYAIAETGSLVFLQNTRAQAALSFLPSKHIVLLNEKDLLASLEQAFARSSTSKTYWAILTVSGPSRTADIEQELHMGAHGPKELLVILYR